MKKLSSPAPKFHGLSFSETIAKSEGPKPSINRTTPYIEIIAVESAARARLLQHGGVLLTIDSSIQKKTNLFVHDSNLLNLCACVCMCVCVYFRVSASMQL